MKTSSFIANLFSVAIPVATCIYLTSWFINLFAFFIILILCLFYGVSKRIYHLNKPEDVTIKPLLFFATISFTLISLILSIQSTILTAYDTNNPVEDNYRWFKSTEILSFPISQYALKQNTDIKELNLDRSAVDDTLGTMNLIIIDKTESLDENKMFASQARGIHNFLDTTILDVTPVENKSTVRNKIGLYLISKYRQYYLKNDIRSQYSVACYDGLSGSLLPVFKSAFVNDIAQYDGNITENYFTYMNTLDDAMHKKGKSQITNINQLIDQVAAYLKKTPFRPYAKIQVHIVSDFYDDVYKTTITYAPGYYKRAIENLVRDKRISAVKLYILPPYITTNLGEVSKQSFLDASKNILHEICKEHQIDFSDPLDRFSEISEDLSASNLIEHSNRNEFLNFYYPYSNYFNPEDKQTGFVIPGTGNELYKMSLTCDNQYKDENLEIQVNSTMTGGRTPLFCNDSTSCLINRGDTVKLRFISNCDVNSKNVYLNFQQLNDISVARYKLNFKPKLPSTTSLYLTLLYITFIISVSLITVLPILSYRINTLHDKKGLVSWKRRFFLSVLTIIVCFNTWYLVLLNNMPWGITAYGLILGILVISIYKSVRELINEYRKVKSLTLIGEE